MIEKQASIDLSIVLPAYLEEENLRLLLPRIKKDVESTAANYEVIVVDTSTPMDGTAAACAEHGVLYVNRKNGNTYGDAVNTGISTSQGQWVLFMDADGSHYPDFIPRLWEHRLTHDIVIASRYVEGGNTENPFMLILMSKIVNWGFSFFLNIPCKDVSNSFKLYRGNELRSLHLKFKNFDIVEEILCKLIRQNKKIKILEVPFSFKQRMFGQTKRNLIVFIFSYAYSLIRLKFFS